MKNNWKPVKSSFGDDLYEIPGYSRYVIDFNKSSIYVKRSGKKLIPWLTSYGYFTVTIWCDRRGALRPIHTHRLVAMAYYGVPSEDRGGLGLTVDHIDCNKQNNHYSNLRWCTRGENCKFAWKNNLYINQRLRKVFVKNEFTKVTTEYESMSDFSSKTGTGTSALRKRLLSGPDRVWPGGDRYVLDDPSLFVELSKEEIEKSTWQYGTNMGILVRYLPEKKIVRYESAGEASRKLGCIYQTVFNRANNKSNLVYMSNDIFYQVKNEDDPSPWREPSDLLDEVEATDFNQSVILHNVKYGDNEEFYSMTDLANRTGYARTTLSLWKSLGKCLPGTDCIMLYKTQWLRHLRDSKFKTC